MAERPKYPNQQLRSVSLEAYFPGRLGMYAALGRIQERVEEHLPTLFVPNAKDGEANALRPFQMRDVDGQRSLAVAINQVTFISFKYPGYDAFAAEAVPVVQSAIESLGSPKLNRVVYRYENELGFARQDAATLVAAAFPGIRIPVLSEGPLAGPFLRMDASYEHAWKKDRFNGVRGFHARAEEGAGMPVFRVTVYGTVEDCMPDNLAAATSAAHSVSIELFEALISDSFRDFISTERGE